VNFSHIPKFKIFWCDSCHHYISTTTAAAFGHATPPHVGATPVPFPRPTSVSASGSCAVHGWDWPNRIAPVHDPSSSSHQGEEGGEDDDDDERRITVVTGPVGVLMIHRTVRISIDPRGRP
jgi:hypothetical protein